MKRNRANCISSICLPVSLRFVLFTGLFLLNQVVGLRIPVGKVVDVAKEGVGIAHDTGLIGGGVAGVLLVLLCCCGIACRSLCKEDDDGSGRDTTHANQGINVATISGIPEVNPTAEKRRV